MGPRFNTWPCGRAGCGLTALWQCGIDVTPRWALSATPLRCIFPKVVCGICKDSVTLDAFEGFKEILQDRIRVPVDAMNLTLVFYDISDGYWYDPAGPNMEKRVKLPKYSGMQTWP